jgi:hypothetical protein
MTKEGRLTAMFLVCQFRMGKFSENLGEFYERLPKLVMDALIISATQKLNVDWLQFGLEGFVVGVLSFLINPAFGLEEVVGLIAGGVHLAVTYSDIKKSLEEKNAKALLLQILIDHNLAKLENDTFYLTLE